MIHCFTSASFAYLDRARVLAETVRRHHPEWRMHLLLCDEAPPGFAWDPASEPFDDVVPSRALPVPAFDSWAFRHDVVEFCTAVKGFMTERLLDAGAEAVVYLDPDIALFAPLVDVERALERHSVVLTPHLLTAEATEEGVAENEIGSLKHGSFNLGFAAVRRDAEGRRFARWWRERLYRWCWDDVPNGLFTDQRWCDLVPSLFGGVCVLRDPGYNVASWNLAQRPITIGADGVIRAADRTLRFFHFTKADGVGETMLRRNARGEPGAFELLRFYRERLAAHDVAGLPNSWWAYARFEDGRPVEQPQRVIYRTYAELQRRFPDPFHSGPGTYQTWLQDR